ncbi:MAG: DUF3493 domain-containing protein [Spirulinaceae cyanobacterium SM2_1_0]|nr:DUF3493 domain-containing protein [Spirulinaceae cyanobacterium SM2_1_0]
MAPFQSPRATKLSPEKSARLRAELRTPYRGLRRFIYVGMAASGFIGGIVFLAQLGAGQSAPNTFTNLAVQIGVVALAIWLLRRDRSSEP